MRSRPWFKLHPREAPRCGAEPCPLLQDHRRMSATGGRGCDDRVSRVGSGRFRMAVLVAGVVVLAVVVVFNLLITCAVLRRLRSHEARLASGAGAGGSGAELIGRSLPEFTATST